MILLISRCGLEVQEVLFFNVLMWTHIFFLLSIVDMQKLVTVAANSVFLPINDTGSLIAESVQH